MASRRYVVASALWLVLVACVVTACGGASQPVDVEIAAPALTVHNVYTDVRWAFASNHTSGLRVYSLADVADGDLSEVAWFDMYPENDNPTFEGGIWSNCAFFRQKNIVAVSSMDRGLFILRPCLRGPQL